MAEKEVKEKVNVFGKIKNIPATIGADVKASSKTTKAVVIAGSAGLSVLSFALGRATKKVAKPTVAKETTV